MDMDSSTAQSHHQELVAGSETLESMLGSRKPQQEKKARPAEQSLKCPRCDSSNTKFCYYNNYSLSQPRYFCKSCRRYWTKGGTLRNVPVGGGCRKAKRSSSSSSSSSSRRIGINHDRPIITLPTPTPLPSYSTYGASNLGMLNDVDHAAFPGADCSLIDALRGGFLDQMPRFQNGFDVGMGMGMGIGVLNQEMGLMGFEEYGNGGGGGATSSSAVKQEMCNGGEKWGFPWQNVGGDGSMHMGELIGNWNGIGSSSTNWHGLLNSPLM